MHVMPVRPNLVAFADAGAAVGLGHLRRTAVIAEALVAAGCRVLFGTPTPEAVPHLEGLEVREAAALDALPPAPVSLVDSYRIAASELAARRAAGDRVVMLDDLADRPLPADLVINPNIYGSAPDYAALTSARVLSGLAWCPVAPRFAALRDAPRGGQRALVAFGGTDSGALAVPVARALRARCDWPFEVVLSPLWPLRESMHAELAGLGAVRVHHGADMAALMARCSHYVGASGSTVWEVLTAGLVPAVAAIADNQRPTVAVLAAAGVAAVEDFDPEALAEAALAAREVPAVARQLDGRGAARIAAEIRTLVEAAAMQTEEAR